MKNLCRTTLSVETRIFAKRLPLAQMRADEQG